MTTQKLISEFLAQKRFAMVGVSRQPDDFSRKLFREFLDRRYEVIPVHPTAPEVDGHPCYRHVRDIRPPVSSALVMTPRATIHQTLPELVNAGVTLVWLYGISGEKEIYPSAVSYCREHGVALIPGYCPYMFLSHAAFFHRFHGSLWKFLGLYPR